MLFEDFTAYVMTYLWKDNDTALLAAMPKLVRQATNELDRVLTVSDRETLIPLVATTNPVNLPLDFRQIIHVSRLDAPSRRVDLYNAPLAVVRKDADVQGDLYAVSDSKLYFQGAPTSLLPVNLEILYRAALPKFEAAGDTSWVADKYLGLYLNLTLATCAAFLREDERIAQWRDLAKAELDTILDEDRAYVTFGDRNQAVTINSWVP